MNNKPGIMPHNTNLAHAYNKTFNTNVNYLTKSLPLKNNNVTDLLKDENSINNTFLYNISNFSFNKSKITQSPSANKEWINSIYAYNKNYTKTLPSVDNNVNSLLYSYFNLTPLINGKKSRVNNIIQRRLTLNKILLSKAEIKHTNDKINLTVYLHNRNKITLLESLNNLYRSFNIYKPFNKSNIKFNKIKEIIRNLYAEKSNLVTRNLNSTNNEIKVSLDKYYNYNGSKGNLEHSKKTLYKNTDFTILKEFTKKGVKLINKTRKVKEKIIRLINAEDFINNKSLVNYEKNYYSKFFNKYYLTEALYIYYLKALSFNNNKFKNWFLNGLIYTISKLYNKKVVLNLVNQKYFYLNSDIFIKAITTRVRNRNNNILREIKYALSKVSLPRPTTKSLNNYNINGNSIITNINEININLQNNIYNTLKYKHVNGLRLEAAGRLSKRLTAARSVFKIKSKGSLKNTDIIYGNRSVTMLRNNVKPNIQYTNVNSKTRNGSFGLKGWINNN